ncbi:MAG: FapA family protein [Treponema sp.]|jgi:uncharacterized protein (DUF342 family)|nr:FapA family protein [Treponema sp.]
MVDFVRLQNRIKERLEQDRTIQAVETEGATLEAAVAEASLLLNIPIRRLEYEVTLKGSPGFWGVGQKSWKIRAYKRILTKEEEAAEEDILEDKEIEEEVIEDKDGEAFVQLTREGALLKVTPPSGNGKRVTEAQALDILASRHITDIDRDAVAEVVKESGALYVKVGQFQNLPTMDASLSVSIIEEEMKATIKANAPGYGGYDLSKDAIIRFLQNNRVVYGVSEEVVLGFIDRPVYGQDFLIAEGIPAHNGRDAHLRYNFETDQSKVRLREGPDGRIDFKELNIIQNVVEGQPLARKISPEKGVPGRTVTGRTLPAVDGKDTELPLGQNVHLGDDGETVLANLNGQVIMANGKISVEPVLTVKGNVDLKTGNIMFLGNVFITGNVEDSFSVKATGNIEVNGTVEKAELDAEGDIIVHQGIAGKGAGMVKAGNSIWARFLENAIVDAGNMVVVSDGIINSQVAAHKRILCQGKRATIVGGRLRATEEIAAKIIGNPTSGTETICEVGFDPQSKERLEKLALDKEAAVRELEETQYTVQTLVNIKKQRKTLPEDKEVELQELLSRRQDLIIELENINGETERIQEFLSNLNVRGRVSASQKVYAGVRIIIRDIKEEVRNEYRAATFVLENGLVRATKYEEPEGGGGEE